MPVTASDLKIILKTELIDWLHSWTQAWEKEHTRLSKEFAVAQEHTSSVIKELNRHSKKIDELEEMKDQVRDLHRTLFSNGYIEQIKTIDNNLSAYIATRSATCPIKDQSTATAEAVEALAERHAKEDVIKETESHRTNRRKDDVWRIINIIALSIGAIVAVATLITKLLGVW